MPARVRGEKISFTPDRTESGKCPEFVLYDGRVKMQNTRVRVRPSPPRSVAAAPNANLNNSEKHNPLKIMTTKNSRKLVFVSLLALVAILLGGCCTLCKFCDQLVIIVQPEDQLVTVGTNATFVVVAAKGPPWTTNGLTYQWQRNLTPNIATGSTNWTDIAAATGSSYTIVNATTNQVGHYRVKVWGSGPVISDPASLNVYSTSGGGGSIITVYGAPVAANASPVECPNSYVGYVNYKKTVTAGWGWVPGTTAPYCAQDGTTRTDTKVEMTGYSGDRRCSLTPNCQPSLTDAKYRFTIYFPVNRPTGSYPIILTGFNP